MQSKEKESDERENHSRNTSLKVLQSMENNAIIAFQLLWEADKHLDLTLDIRKILIQKSKLKNPIKRDQTDPQLVGLHCLKAQCSVLISL